MLPTKPFSAHVHHLEVTPLRRCARDLAPIDEEAMSRDPQLRAGVADAAAAADRLWDVATAAAARGHVAALSIGDHPQDLQKLVGIVEEHCRRALDNSNPQEVEIDIDSLDLPCFLKVDKYVQDCIARAKKKSKAAAS